MKDGILVLDKPQNWTSSDCVAVCRRVMKLKGVKKIGHGGTLDPMATGVLPIFIGQATRIMEYMDLDYKSYSCKAKLGIVTDTLDIWGEIVEAKDWEKVKSEGAITEEKIRSAVASFAGDILQIPPKYSAVRINGKRLYEYAYKGQEVDVEIKPRPVFIKEIDLLEVDMEEGTFNFHVTCSKGTYIRTLCDDIGGVLGCGCTMTDLRRTEVGNLNIGHASITPEEIKEMTEEEIEKLLLPSEYPLVHFGSVEMSPDRADYFSRGNSIRWNQIKITEEPDRKALLSIGREKGAETYPLNARGRSYGNIYKVYERQTGEFLGTGYYDRKENLLKADKVFADRR